MDQINLKCMSLIEHRLFVKSDVVRSSCELLLKSLPFFGFIFFNLLTPCLVYKVYIGVNCGFHLLFWTINSLKLRVFFSNKKEKFKIESIF